MISIVCTKNGDLNALPVEACLTAVVDHRPVRLNLSAWLISHVPFQKYVSSFLSEGNYNHTHARIHLSMCIYILCSSSTI